VTDACGFTVIVDLPDTGEPTYYVIPTIIVDTCLREGHATLITKTRQKGTIPRDTARHAHGYVLKWKDYRNAWHPLSSEWQESAGIKGKLLSMSYGLATVSLAAAQLALTGGLQQDKRGRLTFWRLVSVGAA